MPKGQMLSDIYRAWGIGPSNQITGMQGFVGNYPVAILKRKWEQEAAKLPDGARGFISVNWARNNSAHIYNWEKRGDDIWYVDAQSGKEFKHGAPDDHLHRAEDGIWVARTDNISPNPDNMGWLVTDAKTQHKIKDAPRWVRNVDPRQMRMP
jgi:hypothetical protein